MKYFLLLLTTTFFINTNCQVPENELEEQPENETTIEEVAVIEKLEYYRKHPLDLNEADENELASLLVLDPLHIASFITYREFFGKLNTIYELQAVPGWDVDVIKKVIAYVTVGTTDKSVRWVEKLSVGDHSMIWRFGFSGNADREKFLGNMIKTMLRYRYQYKDELQYGIIGEKDAGEPFFEKKQLPVFDFWSFHFFIKKYKNIKALAVGDYTVNMGQGLIHWQGFAARFGIEGLKRQSALLRPYQSVAESNFMRGLGITYGKRSMEISVFISKKKISANIENGKITSIDNSGYHRTDLEIERKNNTTQFSSGINVKFKFSAFRLGWNAIFHSFSHPISKAPIPANLFSINGKRWWNQSMDFSCTVRNLHVFGEVAVDQKLNTAFIGGLMASLHHKMDIGILYRNIQSDYQTVNGAAHTNNSLPGNERGIAVNIAVRPVAKWKLNLSMDIYRHPWLKFNVDAPSDGYGCRLQLEHNQSKQLQLMYALRLNNDRVNTAGAHTAKASIASRLQLNYKWNNVLIFRTRVEWTSVKVSNGAPHAGFLTFVDLIWEPMLNPLGVDGRVQFFGTDGYDSRIYAFERDVLYYHTVPAFFGNGWRYYINIKYSLRNDITIWLKVATTVSDKASGSGFQTRSEIRFQVRKNL